MHNLISTRRLKAYSKKQQQNVPKDDSVIVFSSLLTGTCTSVGGAYGGLTEGRGIPAAVYITSIEWAFV